MFATIICIILTINDLDAWSGILMDGSGSGRTQLYIPDDPPINTPDIDFGLSHLRGQAAVILNQYAYFTGGGSSTPTNAVTIFNPWTNKSEPGVTMKFMRCYHAASVVNDTILVCGGWNGNTVLPSCEQFTPATQNWNEIVPLPVPTSHFVMTTLNNHVYTFGGSGGCNYSTPVYMFDGQNWVPRMSFHSLPYQFHAGVKLDADRALICGGWAYGGSGCGPTSACFIYSASSDFWSQAARMTIVRTQHSMVMFKGVQGICLLCIEILFVIFRIHFYFWRHFFNSRVIFTIDRG
jgi:hypothetical protein